MIKNFLILVFSVLNVTVSAQEMDFEWYKLFGNTGRTSGLALATDSAGYIYASGEFTGAINVNDTTLVSQGEKDGFLFKLDSAGNLVWTKQFSSHSNVSLRSMTFDHNNDLIVLGEYEVQVEFDTTLRTNNTDTVYSSNVFLAKYSTHGQLQWAKSTGGVANQGNALAINASNEILMTGKSIDIALFDATQPVTTLDSFWMFPPDVNTWQFFHPRVSYMAKLSAQGSLTWIKKLNASPQEITSDHFDNILVTGSFSGDVSFDGSTVSSIGTNTAFVAQYNTLGNLNWVRIAGGSSNRNNGYGLAVDSANNVYNSGRVSGNDIEFDGTVILPFGGADAYLAKYDVNGNFIWNQLIGSPTTLGGGNSNFNAGTNLKIDEEGAIFLLGFFLDQLTFDTTTLESDGAYDLMLLKYDSDGGVLAASQHADYGWVQGTDFVLDRNKDIYLTGTTSLNSWSSVDPFYGFIGKVDESIPTLPLSVPEHLLGFNFSLYPNPSEGHISLEFQEINAPKSIQVFSAEGRLVQALETTEKTIDFKLAQNGIYLVVVQVEGHVFTKRVIVH